mgnify:CR=1 FL=1
MADMNMPKIPVWGWIAIAVGAILLLRPRVAVGQGQGPATPMGSLGQVDMGAHAVPKSAGGSTTVTIGWTGATKSFAGAGISWQYRLRFTIDRASDGFNIDSVVFGQQTAPFNVPQSSFISRVIPAGAPLGLYNVTAFLQAQNSDAVGNPDGTWADIPGAALTHSGAINVVAAAGAAIPAGSIGSVNVSQAMAKAAQRFLQ